MEALAKKPSSVSAFTTETYFFTRISRFGWNMRVKYDVDRRISRIDRCVSRIDRSIRDIRESRFSIYLSHKDFEKRVFVAGFLKSGINNISFETLKRWHRCWNARSQKLMSLQRQVRSHEPSSWSLFSTHLWPATHQQPRRLKRRNNFLVSSFL